MRYLPLLLLALLSTSTFGQRRPDFCSPGDPDRRSVPKVRHTVPTKLLQIVSIETDCGMCTGWIIKEGVFITAAHCFDDKQTFIHAKFEDGHVSDVKLAKMGNRFEDESQDFAILTGDTHGVTPFDTLDKTPAEPGKCISLGYGMERTQKVVPCFGAKRLKNGLLLFAGQVDFGDSGGPVVDRSGAIIAETVMITPDDSPIFFSVPIENILKALKEMGK